MDGFVSKPVVPYTLQITSQFNVKDKMDYIKFILERGSCLMPKESDNVLSDEGCGVRVTFNDNNTLTIEDDMIAPGEVSPYFMEIADAWEQAVNNAIELMETGHNVRGVHYGKIHEIIGYATAIPKIRTACTRKAKCSSPWEVVAKHYMSTPAEAIKRLTAQGFKKCMIQTFDAESGQFALLCKDTDGHLLMFFIDVQMHILVYYNVPGSPDLSDKLLRAFI